MMKNKFTRSVDDKLEDALALLAAGIPLAEILAEAGEDAEWLRPLLEITTEVAELQAAISIPSPQASLQRMLAYGEELAAISSPVKSAQPGWPTRLARLFWGGWLPRLATGLVSALLIVALLGGTLTVLAQQSLPGQPLYSLKRAGETLRLSLTTDSAQRNQLLKNYNQRRYREAKLLLEQNLVATVDFLGQIETMTETSLTLNGLMIQLTPQTKVSGNLGVGTQVEVKVLSQPPDQLIALAITVIEPAPPTPTPLPSPTLTLTPKPSPTVTRSLSSATDTLKLPTATPTGVPTNTPTIPPPPPTITPLPSLDTQSAPTPIPPGGNNENDNANKNDNQDAGNNDNNNNNNDNANDNGNDDSGGDNSGSSGSGDGGSGSGDDNSGSGGSGSGSDSSGSGSSGDGDSSDNDSSGSGSDDSDSSGSGSGSDSSGSGDGSGGKD